MKRKAVSLLLCAVFLLGILPAAPLAESASPAVKFGIEKGDIVHFGGDETPLTWRIIDKDKTNTGDASGILLLNENARYTVMQPTAKQSYLENAYEKYYADEYFGAFYKDAVLPVTVTDADYDIGGYTMTHSSLTDATIFALSGEEAATLLSADDRTSVGTNWWLRSYRISYLTTSYMSYVNASGTLKVATSDPHDTPIFRPAVNLKKEKMNVTAPNGEKAPLLLPAGETPAFDGGLAAVGTADEWKLSLIDLSVSVNDAYTTGNTETSLVLNVSTSGATFTAEDYISAIIVKKDGTVSHYGRYKLTSDDMKIDVALPSGIDTENDSMYVFYERYKNGYSGAVSALKKVCIAHRDGSAEDKTEKIHEITCAECGQKYNKAHNFTIVPKDDSVHEKACAMCGAVYTYAHTYDSFVSGGEENHSRTCSECRYVNTLNHAFVYTEMQENAGQHEVTCSDCGYSYAQNHVFNTYIDDGDVHKMTCELCGAQRSAEHVYPTVSDTLTELKCSVCGASGGISVTSGALDEKTAVLRPELYVNRSATGIFGSHSGLLDLFSDNSGVYSGTTAYDEASGKQMTAASFKTAKATRVKGMAVCLAPGSYRYTESMIPTYITLYGRGADTEEYTKIATVPVKNIAKILDTKYDNYYYVFDSTEQIGRYGDYKAELTGNSTVALQYIGLLTEPENTVSYDLSGVITENTDEKMYPYEDYNVTLVSRSGHPSAYNVLVTVKEDVAVFEQAVYNAETGLLALSGEFLEPGKTYEITAIDRDTKVNVSFNLTDLKADGELYANFGTEYVCRFTDSENGSVFIPSSMKDITVTVGGADKTGEAYLDSNCNLHIPGKSITGDIVISAHEVGTEKGENSVVSVDISGYQRTHYFDSLQDAQRAVSSKFNKTVTFLSAPNWENVCFTVDSYNTTFNLNGNNILLPGTFLQIGKDASVTINGNGGRIHSSSGYCIKSSGNLTVNNTSLHAVGKDENGNSCNLNAVYANGGEMYINCSEDTDMIDGVTLTNGAALTMENGYIAYELIVGSNCRVKLMAGVVSKLVREENAPNYLDIVPEGRAIRIYNGSDAFDALLDGTYSSMFAVVSADGILTKEPQDMKVNPESTFTLSVAASNDATYQWFDENGKLDGENGDTLTVNAVEKGNHSYYCVAYVQKTGSQYFVKSRTAHVKAACLHENLDENNVCANCGETVVAKLIDGNQAENCTNIYDAASEAAERENLTVQLVSDVSLSNEYDRENPHRYGNLIFSGKNTVLDLNGKSINNTAEGMGYELDVTGTLTIKGGTVNAKVFADDGTDETCLTIEDGTFTDTVKGKEKSLVLKGGTFSEIQAGSTYCASFLAEGKVFKSTETGKFVSDSGKYNVQSIANVSVCNVPFVIAKEPQSMALPEGEAKSIAVELTCEKEYEDKITYTWYKGNLAPDSYYPQLDDEEVIEGAAGAVLALPTDLSGGETVSYRCVISCEGYEKSTKIATYTFGVGKPEIDSETLVVNPRGNDLVAVLAGYDADGKMIDLAFEPISADAGPAALRFEDFDVDESAVKLCIFLWKDFKTMIPLAAPVLLE